jgi:hypothetical protein
MLRTKHRRKRRLNYTVTGVTHRHGAVIVDFQERQDGSVYQTFFEVGMKVHVDYRFNEDRGNTAGTTITPLL